MSEVNTALLLDHFQNDGVVQPSIYFRRDLKIYPLFNMMVNWRILNESHLATTQCAKGAERKRRGMEEKELQESSERDFQAYGEPLETVTLFKYLGQVMMAKKDDCPAVAGNLRKDWKSWTWTTRILVQEGEYSMISVFF